MYELGITHICSFYTPVRKGLFAYNMSKYLKYMVRGLCMQGCLPLLWDNVMPAKKNYVGTILKPKGIVLSCDRGAKANI